MAPKLHAAQPSSPIVTFEAIVEEQYSAAMMKTANLYSRADSQAEESVWRPSRRQQALAWTVHAFTATGAIWGLLALLAISNDRWIEAFAWMGVAVFVDAFDGIAARRLRVKEALPEFDGALLDNILDYLNYVFVPAYFLAVAGFLPQSLRVAGAVLILLASAYQFCQSDAKTEDHYFKGFPSYWNIMVFYMFILNLPPWLNMTLVVVLSVLVFVPIKYIYPRAPPRRADDGISRHVGLRQRRLARPAPNAQPWLITARCFTSPITSASASTPPGRRPSR